ncbi:MAG: hypothetical protein FWD53_03565, partial [Phycisphaerales bacterium]|nr:hypothetical protein [Phycisphaerales bacterium]
MRKKISLLIVGMALFLGAFLLYQYATDAKVDGGQRTPPGGGMVLGEVDDEGKLSVQKRDEKGNLLYDFTATEAIQIKGADGKAIPGHYEVTQPLAKYYLNDGRLVALLRADHGTLAIDMASKRKGEAFGGKLSGNVRLMLSPVDMPIEDDGPKAGQVEIRLDKDLEMSMADSVLSSFGGVHVRSEEVSFDGGGLTVAFNRGEQRIEYLRIDPAVDKDNEILVRGMGRFLKEGAKKDGEKGRDAEGEKEGGGASKAPGSK